ncbi:MAG: hypothetical protein QOE28_1077 [Solirubrobacteraceae bacterium]|jgi:SAM-dependent methyltransferase|nr:hypothetical protein [Solirubrobacteraceae bacterium]
MAAETTYDEIRYSSYPYAQTHPDRLAAVAALYGLRPPDPSRARVLELGCGEGANLTAMAAATPGITGVGVDLAAAPIRAGNETLEAIGLTRVQLRQGDITELTDGRLGEFDYVIAHGVFAWVPDPVRDSLLDACHSHLSADGLAFISYNALPGGHVRRILREVGLWYARKESGPSAQATKAQELYRFLERRAGGDDWWGGMLEGSIEQFSQAGVYRLVHDDLSEAWEPVWFADFAARAAAHGLAYVGDADLTNLLPRRVPAELADELIALADGDRIAYEQITDVVRGVFFRQSVLTRDSRTPAPTLVAEGLHALYFAARPAVDTQPGGLLGSALELLRARLPDTLSFEELRAAVGASADALGEALLAGFEAELVMPHGAPLHAASPGDRPLASPLARHQARTDVEVTSLAYTSVRMEEPAARLLLTLLDGTRDRAQIRAEFAERAGVRLSAEDLDANLEQLGKLFLLMG